MKTIMDDTTRAIIDKDTVRHIADLSRLKILDDEAILFSQQFSQIIEYFEILNDIETEGVQPANNIWPTNNIYRIDEEHPSMSQEKFLNNAPQHEGPYIKVPQT